MSVTVQVKNVRRGNARVCKGKYYITIPQWAIDRSDEYGVYYICHECAHVTCARIFGTFSHNSEFRMVEDAYLEDFGLVVKRKKVYPKELIAFGELVDKC